MSWGIAETASEIEKIKEESSDYLFRLSSDDFIDWNIYDYVLDFYAGLLMKAYEQGRKDAQQETCEDAVSRKKVIDAVVKESQADGAYGYMDTKSIVDLLNDLPSVTPKPFHNIEMREVLAYIDGMPEDVWKEFTDCLECRGWSLERKTAKWCGSDFT